jgi:ribonuclease E
MLKSVTKKTSMENKILINASDPEECRIAKVKENKLEEFHFETSLKKITKGNIYKGIISRVEPSLQAVFVDYGENRHGFLQKQEIHCDYFYDDSGGDRSLKKIVKRGQELLVQVTKDPVMEKGATLTTFISLPGRHVVLMPGGKTRGISRKIDSEEERKRLKKIVGKLPLPEGFGLIVRTAGENCTKTLLSKDLSYLTRLWKSIQASVKDGIAPTLLYKDLSFASRSIRDYFTSDVNEILIDDQDIYNEVKDFIKIISPKHTHIVKLFKGAKPIFTKYQLEKQIASIFESRVKLPSGGSIVLDQTEALVAIDVNSGKSTKKDSVGQTAFQTNIEAAEEITRQLRLRDLGGLLVIDFIDMMDQRHRAKVEKAMKSFMKEDKARSNVGKISKFGLMEMSRQRIMPSIESGNFVPCKHCKGKGLTLSTETLGLGFLRKLSLETLKKDKISSILGVVPTDVAAYLLNSKRSELIDLEERRGLSITIQDDSSLIPGESKITWEK